MHQSLISKNDYATAQWTARVHFNVARDILKRIKLALLCEQDPPACCGWTSPMYMMRWRRAYISHLLNSFARPQMRTRLARATKRVCCWANKLCANLVIRAAAPQPDEANIHTQKNPSRSLAHIIWMQRLEHYFSSYCSPWSLRTYTHRCSDRSTRVLITLQTASVIKSHPQWGFVVCVCSNMYLGPLSHTLSPLGFCTSPLGGSAYWRISLMRKGPRKTTKGHLKF